MIVFQNCGSLSGFTINQIKSEIMIISIDPSVRLRIQEISHAKWKDRGSKYLGIKCVSQLHHMIQDNTGALIAKLKHQLKNWAQLPLSW